MRNCRQTLMLTKKYRLDLESFEVMLCRALVLFIFTTDHHLLRDELFEKRSDNWRSLYLKGGNSIVENPQAFTMEKRCHQLHDPAKRRRQVLSTKSGNIFIEDRALLDS